MGEVEGIVVEAFGEMSSATLALINHMSMSTSPECGWQLGTRGQLRSEEAEIAITTAFLRRTFSICAVKGQAHIMPFVSNRGEICSEGDNFT